MKPFSLIFAYVKKYTGSLIITSISMLALVVVQLLIPWIIRSLVSLVTDAGVSIDSMGTITKMTLLVLAVYIARAILQFIAPTPEHDDLV